MKAPHHHADGAPRFLAIRRDNIGDLVCTTPLLRSLRAHFPTARIDVLVNSYNRPVLANNPDIDAVYAYTKAKHRDAGESVAGVYWDRARLLWRLRREHYDYAIIANTRVVDRSLRLARWVAPRHIVAFVEGDACPPGIDMPVRWNKPRPMHLVEELAHLLRPFGIDEPPPPARVVADPAAAQAALAALLPRGFDRRRATIAIHISARKVKQRWPVESFTTLIRRLHGEHGAQFLLFWSPGDDHNPLHPGDDAKARVILDSLSGVSIFGFPTHTLAQLIAGLSLADVAICSDGGAMHIAAALGKPIVCLFGNSDASVWHPWGVPYELLQKPSEDVRDIGVDEVVAAYRRLRDTQHA